MVKAVNDKRGRGCPTVSFLALLCFLLLRSLGLLPLRSICLLPSLSCLASTNIRATLSPCFCAPVFPRLSLPPLRIFGVSFSLYVCPAFYPLHFSSIASLSRPPRHSPCFPLLFRPLSFHCLVSGLPHYLSCVYIFPVFAFFLYVSASTLSQVTELCFSLIPLFFLFLSQKALYLSNLQQFAKEFALASSEGPRSAILKKAAAALRETEMRERGSAWTDSYDQLLHRVKQQEGAEEFPRMLKKQRKRKRIPNPDSKPHRASVFTLLRPILRSY